MSPAAKPSTLSRLLLACFGEPGERLPEAAKPPRAERRECLELVLCFGGLMAAYLVWGLLQEKIMTQVGGSRRPRAAPPQA